MEIQSLYRLFGGTAVIAGFDIGRSFLAPRQFYYENVSISTLYSILAMCSVNAKGGGMGGDPI